MANRKEWTKTFGGQMSLEIEVYLYNHGRVESKKYLVLTKFVYNYFMHLIQLIRAKLVCDATLDNTYYHAYLKQMNDTYMSSHLYVCINFRMTTSRCKKILI